MTDKGDRYEKAGTSDRNRIALQADALAAAALGVSALVATTGEDNEVTEGTGLLLTADVGVDTTARIIDDITARVKRRELSDPQALTQILKTELRKMDAG